MKNWKKLLGLGIAAGIMLILIQYAFKIDTKIFQIIVAVVCVLLFLGSWIYHSVSSSKFRKRVQGQMAMMKEGKPEEALRDMESLVVELDQNKRTHEAALCRLNMTAAYRELKEYDKALDILDRLSGEKFDGLEDLVYRLNHCICSFYAGKNEQGLAIYKENEKLFEEYDHHKRYGSMIVMVTVFATIAEGNVDYAQKMLDRARNAYPEERYQADLTLLEQRLTEARAAQPLLPDADPAEEA